MGREEGCLKDAHYQNLDTTGNIGSGTTTTGAIIKGYKVQVTSIPDKGSIGAVAISPCKVSESGTIFLVPQRTGAAQTILLPPCANAVGCTWHFVATATVGQDFDVITNGSEKIGGAVTKGNGGGLLAISDFESDSCGFDATAVIGSRFSITCISSIAANAFIAHDIIDGREDNTGGINLK